MSSKNFFDLNDDEQNDLLAQELFDELFRQTSAHIDAPDAPLNPPSTPLSDASEVPPAPVESDSPSAKRKLTPQQKEARRKARLRRQRQRQAILAGGGLLLIFLLILLLKGCTSGKQDSTPIIEESAAPVTASAVVVEDKTATLAVVGDIMTHGSQITDAYNADTDSYDFTYCLENIADLLQGADFTMGNLETTMGGGTPSGYPLFNSPDELAESLHTLGFDLVTTANNHCLDTTFDGLSRTLDVLDEVGIDHVGTYRTQEEFDQNQGVVLEDINGISVAFLNYTYAVNGMPVYNDFSVNIFNSDYTGNQITLDKETMSSAMDYAKSLEPDLIIVYMHWGIEYQIVENDYQDQIADYLISQGADAVLGGHPHVCQPMEYRTVTDDDGVEHTGFVCFSLGNFISGQTLAICGPYTQDTAILNLTLTLDGETGKASISDVSYTPLYFLNRGSNASPQYRMYNIKEEIANYEAGDPDEYVDETVYNTLVEAEQDLEQIFGSSWKAVSGLEK